MTFVWRGAQTALVLCCLAGVPAFGQQSTAPTLTAAQVQTQAQNGDAVAQRKLGALYMLGDGVLQNFAQAADWFGRAAAQGDAQAQNQLARLYFEGLGVPRDTDRATVLFEQAALSGVPSHMVDLGRVLELSPETTPRAADLYQRAAQAGDAEAKVSLGTLYQEGRGVAQDFAQAHQLFQDAAQTGSGRALNNLGLLYVRGNGVAQDYARAAELFEGAAELGTKQAFRNLGVLYENGFGVPLNEALAANLYQRAGQEAVVEQGSTARYVYDARLVPLDGAAPAVQTAADRGDPVAQFQRAWQIVHPNGDAPVDARRAAQLFAQSARAGYGPAMVNLGMMYFRGEGLLQDYVLGHMWMSLGRAAGVVIDPVLEAEFSTLPTAEQINESQRRALAWRANDLQ